MIHRIVKFALEQRFLMMILVVLLILAGAWSVIHMPVDAYPDLSPPMVDLVTQWPGHAAEEVERLTTLPLELAMNGTPRMRVMRSVSFYGLSEVVLTFDEGTDDYFARQVAFERLSDAELPAGITPGMSPLFSPSGLVYRYVLESPDRTPQELHTFEDWVVGRAYRSVPGVADDSGFGGPTMEYHVLLDPVKLYNFHIPVAQVVTALSSNNANSGGGFYSKGGQFNYVRGLGLLQTVEDIGEVPVSANNGAPVRIKDIGRVEIGHAPRLGIFGFENNPDAVEGVILMRRGEQTQTVLKGVQKKTEELNRSILPPDVKVRPYYDRSDLVQVTTDTVKDNLLRGMLLVVIVLIFFLGSVRAALIAALTIPLALLFAFVILKARGDAANLLSIGAIDFGIIIDGTIVMVENIYRELGLRHGQSYKLKDVLLIAAHDVDRPIFYSVAVIIAAYLPIYALTGPAGLLFRPMANTMAFALVGALILTLTVVPVVASFWFTRGAKDRRNPVFEWIRDFYEILLGGCLRFPKITVLAGAAVFAATAFLIPGIGGEFLPHLDEGALWVRATMPYTISFEDSAAFAPKVMAILKQYPQVTVVGSELGRPDDGTDPTGFFNDEFYVGLRPYKDKTWLQGPIHNKAELIADVGHKLESFPGVIFNYTQPAEDAVDEALTGLKSALAVKIFGDDLNILESKAVEIKRTLDHTPGFEQLTVVRELGQPSLIVSPDRQKIARYGINIDDVGSVVNAAIGGEPATQVVQGEKLFDLVVRMDPRYRSGAHEIGNLLVPAPGGQQIPLSELASINESSGASFIYRENNQRYIGVQFSVKGRDLEGVIKEGQAAVNRAVHLPQGYRLEWGGEYSQLVEAKEQFAVIGPLAVLLIFLLLFALYGNLKFPMMIVAGVGLTAPVGALIALKLTHTPFSVSSVLGLLAVLGVSVETAVILVSYINKLRLEGMSIHEATLSASLLRLRPIMMTALVACLGLLPAAMATGVGSDTQKPFAIVVVAGPISSLLLGFFVNPALYKLMAREKDLLKV